MMSVLGWMVALGIIVGVVLVIFMAKRQQQKRHSDADSNQNSSSPAHKKASKKRGNDDFQNSGKFFDDLPNTADYVSYRLACHKEDYLEQHSPPIHPPLSFLPQNPCTQHECESAVFKYPTPGNIPPYTFPKEQYV